MASNPHSRRIHDLHFHQHTNFAMRVNEAWIERIKYQFNKAFIQSNDHTI
jgi:hypothetical protein